jgi:hypothetical protein
MGSHMDSHGSHMGSSSGCREDGVVRDPRVAKDSSGQGNDLPLIVPPVRRDVTITKVRHPHKKIWLASKSENSAASQEESTVYFKMQKLRT